MANIALVSSSDETNLYNTLQDSGANLVYKLTEQQLLSSVNSELKLDLIVFTRLNNNTTYAADLITYLNNRRIPIIVGYVNYASSGLGSLSANMLGMLGLSNSVADPSGKNITSVFTDHPIISNRTGLTVGNTFTPYNGSEYMTTTLMSNIVQSAVVLTLIGTTEITSAYFKRGINTLLNDTLKMDVIFLGFLSSRTTHTPNGLSIIRNAIEYLAVKKYKVSGSVTTLTKDPLERNIFVLDQAKMELLEKGRSASDGLYTIHLRDPSPVVVVCTPESTDKNALISYNITPILREDIE